MSLTRRQFVKAAGAAAGGLALSKLARAEPGRSFDPEPKMPTRPFGKTGWDASIYAMGSAEIPEDSAAIRAINLLIDGGVNYLDTAPSYEGTRSESVLGQVMKTRRKEVFLATKTLRRDADGAYEEVKQSLRRLQTDHVDLIQLHAVNDFDSLDRVLAKGGAIEGLERAKKDGLVRFIGITGHTRPEVFLKAIDSYAFASILVPVSAIDKSLHDFADEVIPKAKKLGMGVIGMKCLKGIERASEGKFEAADFVRYALSLPIDTLNLGLRREKEAAMNLSTIKAYEPMPADKMRALEESVKKYANDDVLWWKRR